MSELYIVGASVLDDVLNKSGSLKGLVLSKTRGTNVDAKTLLALTANTLSFQRALTIVLEKSDLLKIEKRAFASQKGTNAQSLALLLSHDLLLTSRGRIGTSNSWPPKAAIIRHITRLKAELTKLQIKEGKDNVQELRSGEVTRKKAEKIPRWVRVNERVTSIEAVLGTLQQEGWSEVTPGNELLPKRKVFARTAHLSSVFAFHISQTSSIISHDLYKNGHFILQDLASCFPAEVLLRPEMKTKQILHVLDATAAPGNKTSHLSALLAVRGGESKISAFEHSPDRYKTLISQLTRAGSLRSDKMPGVVTCRKCDFTKQKPEGDLADVTHMLLDPSCSGSGILGRLDYLTNNEEEQQSAGSDDKQQDRLRALAAFQSSMIDHAMHFPSLRRLVYSTCSIHQEENESVVMQALSSEVARSRGWKLAPRSDVLPSWASRGMVEHCSGKIELAESMIRCQPGGSTNAADEDVSSLNLDATNGFFLACFVRVSNNSAKNKKRNQRAREKAKEEKRLKREPIEEGSD